ncbi:MAG: flippase [Candidatus Aenigmarchaeota archaeon]|nr:flippase [Candidatus Aenigmarchaeota archaeon]
MVNYLKKAASGAFFIFLFSILGAIASYSLRFILTSNLTPADYGLFYACLSLVGLFALFNDFGLSGSLVYHISKFKSGNKLKELKSSIYFVFFVHMIFALIITGIIFTFAEFFAINYLHLSGDISKGVFVLKILAITYFVQVGFSTFYGVLQGFQKMRMYAFVEFCRLWSWFGFTYLFILLNFSYLSPAIGFLCSYIFVFLLFSPLVLKLIPKVKLSFNKELSKKLVLYGLPLMLSSAAGMIIGDTDTILITFFLGLEKVGIYQTAQPTARLLWFFSGAFSTVLFPLVVELKTKKIKGLEKGISLIYRYIWIVIIPLSLMAFSFSKELLNLFFGSFYAQGSDVLKILAIGALFFSIVQINGVIFNGLGKPKKYTKIIYLGATLNLIGNLVFIPIIGITGAAISTLITYITMFLFSFVELRKLIKIKIPFREWGLTLVSGVVSLLSIYLLKNLIITSNLILEVIICFSTSIILFVGLLIFLKVINIKEIIDLTKQVIKK